MNIEMDLIRNDIAWLSDKLDLINNNIHLSWGILGIVIAISSIAGLYYISNKVKDEVNKNLRKTILDIPPIIPFYKELNPDMGLGGYYSKYTIDVNLSKYKINNLEDLLCFSIFEKEYFCWNNLKLEEERLNKDVESINKNGCRTILDNYSLNIDFERQKIEIFIITSEIKIGGNSKKYCEFFIMNPEYK